MAELFPPSVVLWRTIEALAVKDAFRSYKFKHPILDLGCGEGKFAAVVFENDEIDVGLEIEESLVSAASKTGTFKRVVLGDGMRLPLASESFRTVFSNSVIEHIDDLDSVLNEVARVLRRDGLFIATVPTLTLADGLFFKKRLGALGLRRLGDLYGKAVNSKLHHVNLHDKDGWRLRFNGVGLDLVEASPYLGNRAVETWDQLTVEYFFRARLRMKIHRHEDLVRSRVDDGGGYPYGALLLVAKKVG